MATRFIPVDRATPSFLPPSIYELLPKNHMARFVVDIAERLDLSRIGAFYGGRGPAAPFKAAGRTSCLWLRHGHVHVSPPRGSHIRLHRLPLYLTILFNIWEHTPQVLSRQKM